MRATRRAARDDPDPQIHAKETILHLLRLLFLNITSPTQLSRSASLTFSGARACARARAGVAWRAVRRRVAARVAARGGAWRRVAGD